jgi:monovalent cation:H+ antiporter-2, CPA2 family
LLVDRLLPAPMQTFASLYGTWVETLRSSGPRSAKGAIRKLIGALVLDGALLAALVIGTSVTLEGIVAYVQRAFDLGPAVARALVISAAVLLTLPFIIGIARVSRRLGRALAQAALPERERKEVDLARAPRRVLVLTLELTIVLLVGIPLVAVTEPFLPGFYAASFLLILIVALGFVFWKSTADLEGHVRAGAQMIVELLAAQAGTGKDEAQPSVLELGDVERVLPGLGAPVPVVIGEGSTAVGKSLAELNVRGATGATVLVITRGPHALVVPAAAETLHAGDIVALAGTKDAVEAARALLGCATPAAP